MQTTLNYDGSANVRIIVNENHSFQLPFYLTLAGVASDWTGVHTVIIADSVEGDTIMTLTVAGGGLTMAADLLTWDKTVILNTLGDGNYYYEWRSDLGGYSTLYAKGILTVKKARLT